jgi:hypothetical protein
MAKDGMVNVQKRGAGCRPRSPPVRPLSPRHLGVGEGRAEPLDSGLTTWVRSTESLWCGNRIQPLAREHRFGLPQQAASPRAQKWVDAETGATPEATADFLRLYRGSMAELSERHGGTLTTSGERSYDEAFFDAVAALGSNPRGSLGWCFAQFYARNRME